MGLAVGDKCGIWTIIGVPQKIGRRSMIPCRCDCGTERLVFRSSLKDGMSRSCGCLKSQMMTTHGLSRSRIYRSWRAMHNRCSIKSVDRKYYADKGITVCEEWATFIPFHSWAMTHGYRDDLTIDRIDSSLGYSPANCRWADHFQQAMNRGMQDTNTSGVKHVRWVRSRQIWSVDFTIKKNRIHAGTFSELAEAEATAKTAYAAALLLLSQSG